MCLGYVGGGAGLLVGSPLDVLKVRLQTATTTNNANTLTEYRLAEMLRTEGVSTIGRYTLIVCLAGNSGHLGFVALHRPL
jgi:hypothetical protein